MDVDERAVRLGQPSLPDGRRVLYRWSSVWVPVGAAPVVAGCQRYGRGAACPLYAVASAALWLTGESVRWGGGPSPPTLSPVLPEGEERRGVPPAKPGGSCGRTPRATTTASGGRRTRQGWGEYYSSSLIHPLAHLPCQVRLTSEVRPLRRGAALASTHLYHYNTHLFGANMV